MNCELGRALCPAILVLSNDFVLSVVLGAHPQDEHGADATCVGDEVVGVSVNADVIAVPCDVRCRVSTDGTAHVTLVALRATACPQRHQEGGHRLKRAALGFGHVQSKLLSLPDHFPFTRL